MPEDLMLALIEALDARDVVALERLIASRPLLRRYLDEPLIGGEESPLVWAADQGDAGLVEALLGAGADVDAGPYGITALHRAAWNDDGAMIALLLERGADPTRRDGRYGVEPLGWAALNQSQSAIQILRGGAPILNISEAASFGRLDLVQRMIEAAPGRIEGDGDGFTPLRSAAYYGYPEIVRWLLERGARVHGLNQFGYNAFALARRRRWRLIVGMLQEAGAVPPEEEARLDREAS